MTQHIHRKQKRSYRKKKRMRHQTNPYYKPVYVYYWLMCSLLAFLLFTFVSKIYCSLLAYLFYKISFIVTPLYSEIIKENITNHYCIIVCNNCCLLVVLLFIYSAARLYDFLCFATDKWHQSSLSNHPIGTLKHTNHMICMRHQTNPYFKPGCAFVWFEICR